MHSNYLFSHNQQQPVSLSSSPHSGGGFMLHHNGGGGDAGYKTSPPSLAPTPPPRRVTHAPLPTPPVDDMEPQSISFIGKHFLIIEYVYLHIFLFFTLGH